MLIALTSGCASTMDVNSVHDPDIDFGKYSTYRWLSGSIQDDARTNIDESALDRTIREAVDRELKSRGFSLSGSAEADFIVDYLASVKGIVDTVEIKGQQATGRPYSSWKYRRGEGSTTVVNRWRQGTLVVKILDGTSNNIVWEGSAQAEVHRSRDPAESRKRLNQAIRRILGSFPP